MSPHARKSLLEVQHCSHWFDMHPLEAISVLAFQQYQIFQETCRILSLTVGGLLFIWRTLLFTVNKVLAMGSGRRGCLGKD